MHEKNEGNTCFQMLFECLGCLKL